jgi:hypothetical protein
MCSKGLQHAGERKKTKGSSSFLELFMSMPFTLFIMYSGHNPKSSVRDEDQASIKTMHPSMEIESPKFVHVGEVAMVQLDQVVRSTIIATHRAKKRASGTVFFFFMSNERGMQANNLTSIQASLCALQMRL